jgi:hypothetical protein
MPWSSCVHLICAGHTFLLLLLVCCPPQAGVVAQADKSADGPLSPNEFRDLKLLKKEKVGTTTNMMSTHQQPIVQRLSAAAEMASTMPGGRRVHSRVVTGSSRLQWQWQLWLQ